jgi:hypothetical protein
MNDRIGDRQDRELPTLATDREILHTNEILEHRDTKRWELNPQSAEDFEK